MGTRPPVPPVTIQIYMKNPLLMMGPRTQIIREFPLNLICVYFKGKSLLFFSKKSTFRLIFEKCRRSIVILKIVGATLQLDQNINPQDICPDNFSFGYKYI